MNSTGKLVRESAFNRKRIAVLGAGIMGSSVALFLARKGVEVTLIDAAPRPFSGASRWNEGKIHLGYLYSADPTLESARALLPGGLAFKSLVEELIGSSIDNATTRENDLYLVNRKSVVDAAAMRRYFDTVAQLVRSHPAAKNYLVDVSHSRIEPLSRQELGSLVDTQEIVAGFRVPERSVSTLWVADRYVDALSDEPRIALCMGTKVLGIVPKDTLGHWQVSTEPAPAGTFDFVVNTLWEGRLAVDATLGLKPEPGWSHRYRLSLFVRTSRNLSVPSAVIAVGPFGDIKNYNSQEFYLSWYPAGLIAEGHSILPPSRPSLDDADRDEISAAIARGLCRVLAPAGAVVEAADCTMLGGGWVFALGKGALDDPAATIHRRDRFGIRRYGSYISVDTGKYSIAPWIARRLVEEIG
ncbi:MAG: FAD-dependent oxidoreductase [Hyphomicrobiales bacterium]